MPHRAASPTASDNEFDITKSLFQNDANAEDYDISFPTTKDVRILDAGGILDGEGSDGDDAFIASEQAASYRKGSNLKGKTVKKGGGFQAMSLNANLLKAIARKGFSVPTPIQRKTIPLVLDSRDVVGMARTGSGKTAAFVIPMIQKLKVHSARIGARALILSPSRELALQTLKVVKEFGRGTDLKCVLLVGGDSIEEQFGFMAGNPDIVIATPGRFLHLKVEMSLDLSSVKYVVFDEADRLFEMGFAAQLTEILHALPVNRQTLLFSATLPKSMVEFTQAGLQEPTLVRLDAESKVSPDLESAFFSVKSAEKEGALLHILQDLIKMPTGPPEGAKKIAEINDKKRKRGDDGGRRPRQKPTEHSTIVFASTKHHVDYLASLLRLSGFAVSHAYGSLDQVARNMQVEEFRTGLTNILVVTDVAARGIDIPVLANVINYDFPPQPKIFVHRVGRTARAGQRGWSYSLVQDTDCPYLLDLQLFLGKKILLGRDSGKAPNYAEDVTVGSLLRTNLETTSEWITKLLGDDDDLSALRTVAGKGEKLYKKTRNSASNESAKRGKDIVASKGWNELHPLFNDETNNVEQARIDMLERINGFRPQETVFEIGTRGKAGHGEAAEMMRHRREKIVPRRQKDEDNKAAAALAAEEDGKDDFDCLDDAPEFVHDEDDDDEMEVTVANNGADMEEASDGEIELTFSKSSQKGKGRTLTFRDSENFMSYIPKNINAAEERGYGVHSGSYNTASQNSNFIEAARGITMDLTNDDGAKSFGEPARAKGMRWDKKNSKYVARVNDEDGSKGKKMIRGESGQKIAASFQSGRYDRWRKTNKVDRMPRTGEAEREGATGGVGRGMGTRYKHKQEKAPKEADKYRDDYHVRKKRVAEAKEKRVGVFKDGIGKREIKSTDDIRKTRKIAEMKKAKNGRAPAKGKR
ncbi:ATP-dependent RNA helicase dbp10 [Calycina marina]|uniref:RNA helicase n=1 Tax=Calycina marina TaxID=1763456 RepID=A0A9P7Z6C0_9HELO|nr:ATP-dependent RNA helicase dbp10 [Calycina marina]